MKHELMKDSFKDLVHFFSGASQNELLDELEQLEHEKKIIEVRQTRIERVNRELQQELKQKEDEITVLKTEMGQLQYGEGGVDVSQIFTASERAELQKELLQKNSEITDLKQELEQSQRAPKELDVCEADTASEHADLQKELQQKELQQKDDEITALKQELEQLQCEHKERDSRQVETASGLKELSGEYQQMVATIRQDVHRLELENEQFSEKLKEWQGREAGLLSREREKPEPLHIKMMLEKLEDLQKVLKPVSR